MSWIVYILRCADETLYTGITNDLERRLARHGDGTGAKYTKGRGPFEVLYTEPHPDRSAASRRELALKKLSKAEKLELTARFVR
jgi:putative endonuclease